MRIMPLILILLCISQDLAAAELAELVTLRSAQNDRYVRAGIGENSRMAAGSPGVDAWERFRMVQLQGDHIALQSIHSGKYVRAGIGQESFLGAVSSAIGGWEKFRLYNFGDGQVALQSVQSGKYVRAGVGKESYLAAASGAIGAWEKFYWVTGKMIANEYANIAVEQQKQNIAAGLELTGPEWSSGHAYHFKWALKTNVDGRQVIDGTTLRANALRNGKVTRPAGLVTFDVILTQIECREETDEVGSDEPYVLATIVDQGPNFVNVQGVNIDVSVLTPNIETTLYGPWNPVWAGEVHRVPDTAEPFWNADRKPGFAAHPDDPILVVTLMENDDGNPSSARSLAKSTAVGTMAAAVQLGRASRVQKLIDDIQDVLGTPTGAPNFDEHIGTQELRLSYADLVRPWFGNSRKVLDFAGDGGRYRLTFEIRKTRD